jgi:hypothetical protein
LKQHSVKAEEDEFEFLTAFEAAFTDGNQFAGSGVKLTGPRQQKRILYGGAGGKRKIHRVGGQFKCAPHIGFIKSFAAGETQCRPHA